MNPNVIIPHTLDDYFASMPIGSVNKAIINNLYGLNHRQIAGVVPPNKDTYGLTFFVRPQLNLQTDNIRNYRLFTSLLSNVPTSIQRYVRTMLDPRLAVGYTAYGGGGGDVANKITSVRKNVIPPLDSPLVDMNNPFITVMTNNLSNISGWPDIAVQSFTSAPGLYNENYSQVDSVSRNFEAFTIDANFRNTRGDPILYMIWVWLHYMSSVFEGRLVPYLDFITENVIDYNSRIYRLVLDPDKETVRKIASTGVCYPISVPTGSFFDFDKEKPFNDQNKDISIRFQCLGAEYFDDILIKEFNDCVEIFNPSMGDGYRHQTMIQIDREYLTYFNNRGYPRINTLNNKLEWWINRVTYDRKLSNLVNNGLINV